MKTIKTTIAILALAIFSISCSKDDEATPAVVIPEQNPLAGYLTASGFDQALTNHINSVDYEFGYSFTPLVNGTMTAIVAKIPDIHIGMRVTIWDKVAGTVLRTESIDMIAAGVEVTKAINALTLVKDKEYFITFNSNDWYDHRKTDNSAVTYPFTIEDIKITGYSYATGTAQAIPNTPQTTYYAGDVSFKFQK
ncbi:MAG: hypothetical protein ABI549_06100 [Flavobacterium sp.]|uniref:hypothetical protein n=1 Tax=Flavobacterium sp. TaxID=239 RepID=UPI003267C050